mgnify:CR=1 FL=1
MTDEVTGALPAEEPVIKATQPKTGGLTIAGQKGVSLNAEQSADIKAKLLEMIAAREEDRTGIGAAGRYLAQYAGPTSGWAGQQQAYQNAETGREQDIMNMRLGIAQMDTDQQRLAQAKAEKARNDQMFFSLLGVPAPGSAQAATQPQAGGATPQAGGAAPQPVNAGEPMAEIFALYQQDPKAAITKLIEMRKQSDVERQLRSAGIQPGSPTWNAAMLSHVAGSGAFVPHDVRGPGGTMQTTPLAAATAAVGGGAAPAPAAPAAPVVRPAATSPITPPPAAPAAPVAAPPVAPPPAAPAAPAVARPAAPAPARVTAPAAGQPGSVPVSEAPTGFTPGSAQDLAVREDRAKAANEELKAEAAAAGKATATELETHRKATEEAIPATEIAQAMQKDIRTADSLVGKLAKGGGLSAIMGFVDKGISAGTIGTVNVPGFKEAMVKMDPNAKNPEVMDAYMRVARNLEQLKLDYSRKVFKGQGAVSDNERKLIASAVGDADYTSPANLMKIAKANELEARNQMDQDRLWKQMSQAGYTWRKFKDSPELADMKRNQFYRTARTFGITNAKYPGDQ